MMACKYFKDHKSSHSLLYMHPMAIMVMMDMLLYIVANGETAMITSAIRTPHQDRVLQAQSETHQGARAWDLHANSWSKEFRKQFFDHFTLKYKGHGATNKAGEEVLIVFHGVGDNFHAHIQLSRLYTIPDAWLHL
jgi:hypothetical protein